ncbi:MAG: DUF2867 domain-containing protein [Pseudomonadota bacterium]
MHRSERERGRSIEFGRATPVALPAHCAVAHIFVSTNLADAFAILLPLSASSDPDVLARFIVENQPGWIGKLAILRDLIVSVFGLKTAEHLATLAGEAKANRVGIFKVYSTSETEIVLGEDDKHLDFRASFLCTSGPAPESSRLLTVSTVVHCHNLLGRAYILVIAPFHRMVVKASLGRAASVGWPQAVTAVRL